MKFSQNDEELFILDYFKDSPPGRFLDIGAYTGKELSNTWELAQRGWCGLCVEPSPDCFTSLMKNYEGNPRVTLLNACVGTNPGLIKFYNSGGAVATTNREHYERWSQHQKDFREIYIPSIPFSSILREWPNDKYDFLSIDTEGSDWDILVQIPLQALGVKMICIEYGSNFDAIGGYLKTHGFRLIHQNGENVIYAI